MFHWPVRGLRERGRELESRSPVPEHPVSQTGDLWLLGATVTCPKCRKTSPLERAIKR